MDRLVTHHAPSIASFFDLSQAAPKAVLVLGSLPSGFAYPADPGPEIQRLRSEAAAAGLGKGAALDKVGECLYYQGPSYLWNATPEVTPPCFP